MSRTTTRRTDTRDPRRARARALKLLYQADVRGQDPLELLEEVAHDPRAAALLDDLDPEESADLVDRTLAADHPDADPEPHRNAAARRRDAQPLDAFTRSLVRGVAEHREELDARVQRFARRWSITRMPAVDRSALRLGTFELEHETTSAAVVINEIVELAKALSTDDSGRYVNGVLESVRKDLLAESVDPADAPDDLPSPPEPPAVPDGTLVAVEVPEPETTPAEGPGDAPADELGTEDLATELAHDPAPDAWLADPEEDLGPEASFAAPHEPDDEVATDEPGGPASDEAADLAPSDHRGPSAAGGAVPDDAEAELRAEHGELAEHTPAEAAQQQLF